MRTTRIYQPGDFSPGEIISLSAPASQHVARVLRMRLNDQLILFNGNNKQFLAKIVTIDKRAVSLTILSAEERSCESKLKIHLGQCISKGDKMDLVIQKAVELGVSSITPIFSQFCNVNIDNKRTEKKHKQWQDQVISACEQSGRNFLPTINFPCKLQNFIEQCSTEDKFVLHPSAAKSWQEYPDIIDEVSVLIGPEGGLSDTEIKAAQELDFKPLSMGPRVLRTETAAISILSILQALYGDI